MLLILSLSTIPALLAAGFDSVGLAVVAIAGVTWAAGISLCTTFPLVAARSGQALNDRIAVVLSTVAAVLAIVGVLLTAL